ncbi:MAG: pyridoxamine 5'-phosphate oxidase family protein [Sulfurimonas sp.]|nr:pyridoxamine 5'-phosphate oxidase family protein [Sulfurimonas sp.]MDQ7059850.1 pyridoxamine 5'-phosphate oxidase family protein [Sulfurimonas sp.]
MQEKFKTQNQAKDFYKRQMLDAIAPHMKTFIAEQRMVFISTSDKHGECDSSFRSGDFGFVRVINEKYLVYPEFKGNGVLASAGNISENPHIGMLFIDFFENKVGLHVNGKAKIMNNQELLLFIDKEASDVQLTHSSQIISFWILVEVEEAYIHCSRNIPLLKRNEDTLQNEQSRPIDYFKLS